MLSWCRHIEQDKLLPLALHCDLLACTSLVHPDGRTALVNTSDGIGHVSAPPAGYNRQAQAAEIVKVILLLLTAWQPAGSGGGCGGGAAQVWAAAAAAQRFPRGQVHLSCVCA